ncbi:MAG: hypothetical protein ACAH80_13900 [Alphaproteobacteria bacterium]
MMYSLHDLLLKMGAPEAREKGRMEWHYFDRKKNALAGFAEIRLEAGGERLVAEMRHIRENHTDDNGRTHAEYTESFYFHAERTARPAHYRVTKISLDGDDYSQPQKAIVELGLSVFHARALDISVRMVEQVFNKQDILTPPPSADITPKMRKLAAASAPQKPLPKKEEWGVVIPFRPRTVPVRANA